MEKIINYIKSKLSRWLLRDTWHICKHNFVLEMTNKEYQEYSCKKCGVAATNQYSDTLMILVNVKINRPYFFEPWGVNRNTKGIGVNK